MPGHSWELYSDYRYDIVVVNASVWIEVVDEILKQIPGHELQGCLAIVPREVHVVVVGVFNYPQVCFVRHEAYHRHRRLGLCNVRLGSIAYNECV